MAMLLPIIPLAIQFGPPLVELAMKLYATISQDPETPEQKRAHYAKIAAALEAANDLVQAAPLPPPGSGR